MIRRTGGSARTWAVVWGCCGVIAWLLAGTACAQDESHKDAEAHQAGDLEPGDGATSQPSEVHGRGHHDPHDLSAANAGAMQRDFTEFRSDLALATLLVFLILLAVLWKFAWGPISEALDRREQGIADQLTEARRNNEQAHQLLAEHRQRLNLATEEVRGMLDQARKDGDALKQRIVTDAEQAATAQKDRALREIEAAKNGVLEELARKSIDQAVGLAGRIVGRQLKKEDHAQLIQETLDRMPSSN